MNGLNRNRFGFQTSGGGGASSIAQLTDVNLAGLANGNFLQYDSGSGTWVPVNISGSGITSLGGESGIAQTFGALGTYTSVTITSASNKHTVAVTLDAGLDNLNDVTISSTVSGQALTFGGANWANTSIVNSLGGLTGVHTFGALGTNTSVTVTSAAGKHTVAVTLNAALDALTDVAITGPATNQQLVYSEGSGLWTNTTIAGGGGGVTSLGGQTGTIQTFASLGTRNNVTVTSTGNVHTVAVTNLAGVSNLIDTTLTNAVSGQVLTYFGDSIWRNTTVSGGGTEYGQWVLLNATTITFATSVASVDFTGVTQGSYNRYIFTYSGVTGFGGPVLTFDASSTNGSDYNIGWFCGRRVTSHMTGAVSIAGPLFTNSITSYAGKIEIFYAPNAHQKTTMLSNAWAETDNNSTAGSMDPAIMVTGAVTQSCITDAFRFSFDNGTNITRGNFFLYAMNGGDI